MKRCWIVIPALALFSLLCTAGDAAAFDGKRRGFLLGFGAGYGTALSFGGGEGSISGVHTDLKIGHGISDQFQVFYTGKQLWHLIEGGGLTLARPSVGVAYYLRPKAPSTFISGSVGPWLIAAGSEDFGVGAAILGPGISAGIGQELSRHVMLEFDAGVSVFPSWGGTGGLTNLSVVLSVMGY